MNRERRQFVLCVLMSVLALSAAWPVRAQEPSLDAKLSDFDESMAQILEDVVFEFEVKDGRVTALKQRKPSGEYRLPRR